MPKSQTGIFRTACYKIICITPLHGPKLLLSIQHILHIEGSSVHQSILIQIKAFIMKGIAAIL